MVLFIYYTIVDTRKQTCTHCCTLHTHLSNRKEFRELFLIEPVALIHQMIAQNGHVGLRSTKGHQSERPKRGKDWSDDDNKCGCCC